MRYSSHRSETAILSTKCRRRIAAFSSGANVRRARFLLIRDPSLLHRVEPEGVTFQLNRNNGTAGDQGSSKSLPMARTCSHANDRDVHARRSVREAGGARSHDRTKTAVRTLQSHGRVDRLIGLTPRYAEGTNIMR